MAVPLTGGATVEVAPGEDPAVSPDGRYLAMVRSAPDHSVKPCFAYPADSVVVRDLVTGSEVTWGATQLSGLVPSGLHWQADSRRLVFRTTSKGDAAPVHWFVDVGAAFSAQSVGITPEPPLPVVTPKSTWTILDGPGPRLLAAEGPLPISGIPVPVVALDPQTGRTRVEFSIASGWPDQGVVALGVAGDDSGRRVALVVHSGELYLWNQGEPGYHADGTTGFRRLTNGIDSVAWVPSRPASLAPLTGTDFSACTSAPPELRALSFRAIATPARRGRATTTVGTLRITNPGPTTVRLRLAAGATGEEIDPRTGQLRAGAPSVAIDWVTKAHVLAPGHSVDVTVQAAAAPVLESRRLRASLEVFAVNGQQVPNGCKVVITGPVTRGEALLAVANPESWSHTPKPFPRTCAAGGERGKSFRGCGGGLVRLPTMPAATPIPVLDSDLDAVVVQRRRPRPRHRAGGEHR